MATLQEQLEQSVGKFNENAGKVHAFINGTDVEIIESTSGNKPTIAKIVKDTETTLATSMMELTTKALQVSEDRKFIEETKLSLDEALRNLNEKYSGGVGSEIGSIVAFPVESVPQGFLICDGATIQKETFPDLVLFLTKDENITEINIPDLRGEFIRGADLGRGIDANRAVGSYQEDAFQGHWHGFDTPSELHDGQGRVVAGSYGNNAAIYAKNAVSDGTHGTPRVASETRPRNYAVVLAIKAFGKVVTNGSINLNGLAQEFSSIKNKTTELESIFSEGFANNKVTNGYTKLPNGLILQWGHLSSGVNVTRNFSIAFPTNCLAMAGANKNTNAWSYGVGLRPISKTQFKSLIQHGDGGIWMAIGY